MKRRLFNLLAAVSLVLCVATVVLWVRSYWIVDRWVLRGIDEDSLPLRIHLTGLMVSRGVVELEHHSGVPLPSRGADPFVPSLRHGTLPGAARLMFEGSYRFGRMHRFTSFVDGRRAQRCWHTVANFPLWLPVWLFSVLPAWGLIRLYRRHRLRPGFCIACGYNLTGNVSGTCPECGTTVPVKASEAGATA